MNGGQGRRTGFTLIELLIVVAIIAILALIAVPNLLEAQTRAKVSRLMADMRSMCVAIEAYRVDNNKYPPDNWPWAMVRVTTPIAYITTWALDPFARRASADWNTGPLDSWYINGEDGPEFSKSRMASRRCPPGLRLWDPPRDKFIYGLVSPGPDLRWEYDRFNIFPDGFYYGDALYYDPTNGTVSIGDVFVFGPGNVYNPGPVQSP